MKPFGLTKLTVMVSILLVVLAIGIFKGNTQFEFQLESRLWVIHTYKVLSKLETLLLSLKSVEANQRTYLLSGDDSDLQASKEEGQHSRSLIKELEELVSDNQPQVERLTRLNKSTDLLLSQTDAIAAARKTKGFAYANSLLDSDTKSGDSRNNVENIAREMSATEQKLLEKRLSALNSQTDTTRRLINLVFGMFMVSLFVVVWVYSASREKAQRSLALQHSISRLLNESEDLYQAIKKIEELAIAHGGWALAATWLLSENDNYLRNFDVQRDTKFDGTQFIDATKSIKFAEGEGLPGRVWKQREAATVLTAGDANFPRASAARADGLAYGFAFPIVSEKNFLGVIEVFSKRKRNMDSDTIDTFESIGREIGRLIERQRSQMRFRAIFNQTFGFIGILDVDGRVLDVNESALKFADVELADVKNRFFWDCPWWTHSVEQQERLKDSIKLASKGEFVRFEASHPAPDGTNAHIDFSIKPVVDTDGTVKYLIPEGRDVSERKEAELKFRAVFDQTYGFVGLLRADGVMLDCNRSALDFAGVELADVINKFFWETVWWQHDMQLIETVHQAVKRAQTGEFVRFETRCPSATGELFDFDVTIKPVFDKDNKVLMLIPEFRNITANKEAERRVSEFYSTVSHELRTPLTSIRGSLGLMEGGLTGSLPDKASRMVKIARSECDRLIRLINDILDLQKIEAGMVELKRTEIDTTRLIERTIEGLKGMAQTLSIDLVAGQCVEGRLSCDEDRITQVLTNLVSNAIKFSPAGASVSISVETHSERLLKFKVSDTGPGIPQEQAHKLFARFQQLDQSDSRQKGGTGLGLAITKAIVEEHGGEIGVESKVGEGSTFWFTLPGTTSQPNTSGHLTNTIDELTKSELPSHIHPALVIEDDDSIAEVFREHLKQDGFEVIRASTLKEARELLQRYVPLVILLDLTLPDGDGLDLLADLSTDEKRKHIPVVIVTGRDKDGRVLCGHPALIDWVEKPFDETKLHEAFNAARKKVGPARVLIVEDDSAAREILSQQLNELGVSCLQAKDGAEAIKAFRDLDPDLIILDLSIPPPDGFAVVDILNQEPNGHKPLIVYSALDLSNDQKKLLKLGLTAHLTKSINSIDQVIGTVREFLDGLVPPSK